MGQGHRRASDASPQLTPPVEDLGHHDGSQSLGAGQAASGAGVGGGTYRGNQDLLARLGLGGNADAPAEAAAAQGEGGLRFTMPSELAGADFIGLAKGKADDWAGRVEEKHVLWLAETVAQGKVISEIRVGTSGYALVFESCDIISFDAKAREFTFDATKVTETRSGSAQ